MKKMSRYKEHPVYKLLPKHLEAMEDCCINPENETMRQKLSEIELKVIRMIPTEKDGGREV